jgi:hypothetical protein
MGFKYAEGFRTLQRGDLEGAIALYGRRDNTAMAAPSQGDTEQPPDLGLQ